MSVTALTEMWEQTRLEIAVTKVYFLMPTQNFDKFVRYVQYSCKFYFFNLKEIYPLMSYIGIFMWNYINEQTFLNIL